MQIRCSRGALQFVYGAGFDNMVVGNEFYDAPGITAFGLSHTDGGDVSPAAFNFLYDNRLTNTAEIAMYGSLRRGEGATESGQGADGSYLYQGTSNLFGNIIRRNQIFTVAMPSGANQYYNVLAETPGMPRALLPSASASGDRSDQSDGRLLECGGMQLHLQRTLWNCHTGRGRRFVPPEQDESGGNSLCHRLRGKHIPAGI